ncbi:hypothetical protein PR003_g17992 [Phytophthora rubi]|uniref:Uncharacterized protein n=1 Tax=Phytophthora rubi TaxID=129364 RepID=A0A6A4EBA7_9STRA|nr:hypothetical protein PR002_g17392 [Phytophthora rubi]KAE9319348.1 hypothetical protein PR003_g17992 [Phytophthora rubi]
MMEGVVTLRDIGESNHLAFRQITSIQSQKLYR